MKTSRKIFIGLLSILAIAMLIFTVDCYIQTGTFDTFSLSLGAGATKATIFFMNINLVSLGQPADQTFEDGTENMGGFGCVGYLALRSHLPGYPTLSTDQSDVANLVKLIGDYTFATGRYFIKLDFVPETVKVTPEGQGEHVGGNSYKMKGEAFIAGTQAKQRGFSRLLNNSYGVLILLRDDGSRFGLGSELRPVKFRAVPNEGEKAADKKGVLISFESDSFVPGYEYYGTIPLTGSTLPAIS